MSRFQENLARLPSVDHIARLFRVIEADLYYSVKAVSKGKEEP